MLPADVVPPARLVELLQAGEENTWVNASHQTPPRRREWLGRGAPATLSERAKSKITLFPKQFLHVSAHPVMRRGDKTPKGGCQPLAAVCSA